MSDHETPELRELREEHVEGAAAAFIMAHPECGEEVEIGRVADVLVCHCALHDETLTWKVLSD